VHRLRTQGVSVLQQLEEHRIKILKVAPHLQGQIAEQRGHTFPDV
jgi:hypothetical protein